MRDHAPEKIAIASGKPPRFIAQALSLISLSSPRRTPPEPHRRRPGDVIRRTWQCQPAVVLLLKTAPDRQSARSAPLANHDNPGPALFVPPAQ